MFGKKVPPKFVRASISSTPCRKHLFTGSASCWKHEISITPHKFNNSNKNKQEQLKQLYINKLHAACCFLVFAYMCKKAFFYVRDSCSKISSRIFRKGGYLQERKAACYAKTKHECSIFISFLHLKNYQNFKGIWIRFILSMMEFRFEFYSFLHHFHTH